jgi:hypothetical protein
VLFALVYLLLRRVVRSIAGSSSETSIEVELVILRHQLMVLKTPHLPRDGPGNYGKSSERSGTRSAGQTPFRELRRRSQRTAKRTHNPRSLVRVSQPHWEQPLGSPDQSACQLRKVHLEPTQS